MYAIFIICHTISWTATIAHGHLIHRPTLGTVRRRSAERPFEAMRPRSVCRRQSSVGVSCLARPQFGEAQVTCSGVDQKPEERNGSMGQKVESVGCFGHGVGWCVGPGFPFATESRSGSCWLEPWITTDRRLQTAMDPFRSTVVCAGAVSTHREEDGGLQMALRCRDW